METTINPHRRRRLIGGALAMAAAVTLLCPPALASTVGGAGAGAPHRPTQEPSSPVTPVPGTDEAPVDQHLPSISPDLAGVRVESTAFGAAADRLDTVRDALAAAREARTAAEERLVDLHASEVELTADIATWTRRKKQSGAELAQARANLRSLAVASYVNGRAVDGLDAAFNPQSGADLQGAQILRSSVSTDQRARQDAAETAYERAVRAIDAAVSERAEVRGAIAETSAARDRAAADEAGAVEELASRQHDVDVTRAVGTVVGTDFALVALDAYVRAAQALAAERPACGVPWWALAGIAKVESSHGTYGGATLLADGDTSQPIVGIALDGTKKSIAFVGDTDGGAVDGDAVVDRAVGPMQFIPSTWARWGRDGNADGVVDPHNLYDAALAAAHYLCASGPLVDDAGLTRGFFSYNHSESYAASVLSLAHTYAQFVIPPLG